MKKNELFYGIGYQAVNLILLFVQAIFLPKLIGFIKYGESLQLLLPIFIAGGLWEPAIQCFHIEKSGAPRWLWHVVFPFIFVFYVFYIYTFNNSYAYTLFIAVPFLIIYLFSIYYIANLNAEKKFRAILILSLSGLSCALCTLFIRSILTPIIFFLVYFIPFFSYGIFNISPPKLAFYRNDSTIQITLTAISTRLFSIIVNNGYILLASVINSPASAASLKIVISLGSAFRFASPFSIGQFYSSITKKNKYQIWKILIFILITLSTSIFIFRFFLDFFDPLGLLVYGDHYYVIKNDFLRIYWAIPFYLWSPYLTLAYAKHLGWVYIFIACIISTSIPFLTINNINAIQALPISCIFYSISIPLLHFFIHLFKKV